MTLSIVPGWTTDDIPDLTGRTALVSGIGTNPQTMTVTALPDGSYRITPVHAGNAAFTLGPEHQFAVVVF